MRKLKPFTVDFIADKIIKAAGFPILILDSTGHILIANSESSRLLSTPNKHLKGQSVQKFFPQLTNSILRSNHYGKEKSICLANKKNISAVIKPIIDNNKKYYFISLKNISVHKTETKKKLNTKNSEFLDSKKLNALFENVDVLLWSLKKDEKGKYYYEKVNEAFASATNRKPSDYEGKLLRKLGTAQEYKSVLHSLNTAKEKGVYEYERNLVHRGKKKYFKLRIFYLPGNNNTEYYIGSASDVTSIKISEERLKISEKKYHDLIRTAPVAILRFDLKTHKIDFANEEFTRQSGFTAEEFTNLSGEEKALHIHADDRKRMLESADKWARAGFKGVLHNQYRAINKKNESIWLDANFYAEHSAYGEPIAIYQIYQDINQSKNNEELLKLSEKKYRDLTEYAPIALTKVDPHTRKFVYVNNEFVKQSGYTMEEYNKLSPQQILNIIYPDDRVKLVESNTKWAEGGYKGVYNIQYRITNKFNKVLWLDAYFYAEYSKDGMIAFINQLYQDITEYKHTEERLKLSEKFYKDLAQYAPIGITHTNVKSGLYDFVNDEFVRQSGYTMEEFNSFSNEQINEMVYPEDREKHKEDINNWVRSGFEGVLHTEYRAINKNKKIVWLEALFYCEFDENKKPVSINQLYYDISQIKNAELELRRSLLEKEILLKEVYHRVKNNLQVINSLLQIQSGSITDPVAKEMFKESQRRIRIMSMIHEKLYKSKDLTQIDFSTYVYSLADYLKDSYPLNSNNVELSVYTNDVYLGLNKAISCGLIINELVSNSYKYAFEPNKKGKINVELLKKNDEFYVLRVEDNGKGFPDTIDFQNTESLGLVIVNSFVDQLEGSIELKRSGGTKFVITFPV